MSEQSVQRREMMCDSCKFKKYAEKGASSFLGRLWVWHTAFCPGWKRYVKARWEAGEVAPLLGNRRGFWND